MVLVRDHSQWSCWIPIFFSDQPSTIQWKLAEGVGFEPTVGFPTLDFESSALNRTQPPFPVLDRQWSAHYRRYGIICKRGRSSHEVHKGHKDKKSGPAVIRLRGKKCYNFRLAKRAQRTASCVSTRTATLLLVVDGYSQLLGAAVHQYSQLIRNLNPSHCHDSTQ